MARIEESVEIKRPVDKVFAFTTDAKSWPKWHPFIPESEQTSQGPIGVGTTFKGVNRMMGLSMKWTAKATEYEPNKKFGKTITCGSMIIEDHLTFNPIETGTRFTMAYDIKVGGFMKLFSPMILSAMRKEPKTALGNLKGVLEAS